MKVSVLMPTYNQAQFLPRALAALENQIYSDFELIVCDDASTDGTAEMLWGIFSPQRFEGQSIRHRENLGTGAAINTAAKLATGDYMTWVSSDNVMDRNWLHKLVQVLDEYPDFGAVYSAFRRIEGKQKLDIHQGTYRPDQLIETENSYFGPSFLLRKEVWCEHRGQTAHDYDAWARTEEKCWALGMTLAYVPDLLCDYHVGPWCSVRRNPHLYDAGKWRAEAIERRKLVHV